MHYQRDFNVKYKIIRKYKAPFDEIEIVYDNKFWLVHRETRPIKIVYEQDCCKFPLEDLIDEAIAAIYRTSIGTYDLQGDED